MMKVKLLRRLAAMFYDSLLIFALMMVATALLLPLNGGQIIPPGTISYQLYLLVVAYLYLDFCWRKGGHTVGMKSWRFKVVNEDGRPLSHKQTFLRFMGGLFSIATLGLGFVLAWPDKLSGTMLVRSA